VDLTTDVNKAREAAGDSRNRAGKYVQDFQPSRKKKGRAAFIGLKTGGRHFGNHKHTPAKKGQGKKKIMPYDTNSPSEYEKDELDRRPRTCPVHSKP